MNMLLLHSNASSNGLVRVLAKLQEERELSAAERAHVAPLPPVLTAVVLTMELALVFGVGLVLLGMGSVASAISRAALIALDVSSRDVITATGDVAAASAFIGGTLRFAGSFFQTGNHWKIARELGLTRLSATSTSAIVTLVAAQTLVIGALSWLERSFRGADTVATFSWERIEVEVLSGSALLSSLALAPLREELFFRGVVFLVVWNRCQDASVHRSALLASALFALVHVANVRRIGAAYSSSYVAYQVGFAGLVGVFLSMRFAVSHSLLECVLLHAVNNSFALLASTQAVVDLTDPITMTAGTRLVGRG